MLSPRSEDLLLGDPLMALLDRRDGMENLGVPREPCPRPGLAWLDLPWASLEAGGCGAR